MANTSWRGLRFAFVGDTPGAYKALMLAVLPAILVFVVLAVLGSQMSGGIRTSRAAGQAAAVQLIYFGGIVLLALLTGPVMWWALKRYQHNHYQLAQERTTFGASVGSFCGVFLKATGLMFLPLVVVGVIAGLVLGAVMGSAGLYFVLIGSLVVVVPLLYISVILVFQPYLATRLQNLVWNCTASPAIGFESNLRARDLLGLNLKNWLLVVLTLGLYWPFAAVAMARRKLQAVSVVAQRDLDELVTTQQQRMKDATGDVAADVFGVDLGM